MSLFWTSSRGVRLTAGNDLLRFSRMRGVLWGTCRGSQGRNDWRKFGSAGDIVKLFMSALEPHSAVP